MQTFVRRAVLALVLLALGGARGCTGRHDHLPLRHRQAAGHGSGDPGARPGEQRAEVRLAPERHGRPQAARADRHDQGQNEKTLSDAEEAFAAGRWDDAARLYSRSLDSDRDWVRSRAVVRLVEAANKSGQFGPAAKAYVELVKVNPVTAATIKPSVPTDKPDAVKPAMDDVDRALAGQLQPTQKELLQNFKAELLIASGRGADCAADALVPDRRPRACRRPRGGPTYTAATAADANQRRSSPTGRCSRPTRRCARRTTPAWSPTSRRPRRRSSIRCNRPRRST